MSFKKLNLIPALEKAITKQGYTTPTPIQLKSIPDLLAGKDLIGIAQTGTGKTAAFVLPILQRMKETYPRVTKTLVLAPTRELAAQIGESFSSYGEFLKFKHAVIFGGVNQGPQINQISKGVDIIVATPGRLLDLMNQGKISLKDIEFFVLDEADRMLDMGFIHDIKKIILRLPEKRQSIFFSATMSREVNELAKRLLKSPVHIEVAPQATTVEKIKQHIFFVDQGSKTQLLLELLKQKHLTKVLVFAGMKHRANKIALFLEDNNIRADAIHGNKTQNARIKALSDFKTGKIKVLVATDIAARGIDIDDISHVINFDLPNEPESYVHRIGRTARAGEEGTSYSFCAADERDFLRDIEKLIRMKIDVMDHEFHSETAKNAEGISARPIPRNNRGRANRFNNRSNNRRLGNRHPNRSSTREVGSRPSRFNNRPRTFNNNRSEGRSRGFNTRSERFNQEDSEERPSRFNNGSRSRTKTSPRKSKSRSFNSRDSRKSSFRRR
ncbi:MAG: DEAD/DEAH box helicase [Candidatus Pacearchaeota archaeon]|jgi:ATP-dependent RNA helicase RhlE